MAAQLTAGAVEAIMGGDKLKNPVFQIMACRKMQSSANQTSGKNQERYRLLLSDGIHSCTVMLATQLNARVNSGELHNKSVITLLNYSCSNVGGTKKVIVVLDVQMEATADQMNQETIGNPVAFNSSTAGQPKPPGGSNTSNQMVNGNARAQSNGFQHQGQRSGGFTSVNQNANQGFSNFNKMGGAGPSGTGSQPRKAQPIASLTPYQNRWTIKVRVANKSDIRTWSNSKGEGKLFSMDLVDSSGEIRATAFKEQVDKYYDMIQKGKVFFITKGTLKPANKQYTSIQNDYELTFNSETDVTPCEEEDSSIPTVQFDFRAINELEDINPDTMVDIIGVVTSAADIQTVTIRSSNREVPKRDLQVLDDSGKVVQVTLWGKEAERFDASMNPILAVKGARLSSFGGRSLSVLQSSIVEVNPDIPRAHQLRGWYDSEGHSQSAKSISEDRSGGGGGGANFLTFEEVHSQNLGCGEKPDYFTTKATLLFAKKENCMYMACPSEQCNKKVIENGDGSYRCEKCNKDFDSFQYRLLLSCNVADMTDNQWVTCFQETAEAILGKKADVLGALKDTDEAEFNQVFQEALFTDFIFRMRIKMETYNDEARLKCTCMKIDRVDPKEQCKKLIKDIRALALS